MCYCSRTNAPQQNGGEIVLLDKNADFIIADHARQDNPPGSTSWKWIEDSVKKGELQDPDDYSAGPKERVVRAVGSSHPVRTGRTPFTAEDDRLLMEWVTDAELKGASLKGNELYKQLEAQNPRHTFQSWRDRWVKTLSLRSRPVVSDNDEEDDNTGGYVHKKGAGTTALSRTKGTKKPYNSKIASAPPRPRSRRSSPEAPERPVRPVKSSTGRRFTEEEDDLLLVESKFILNLDPDKTIEAWVTWADRYPTHSAQEWSNRFKGHILPRLPKADDKNGDSEIVEKVEKKKKVRSPPERDEQSQINRQLFPQVSSKPKLGHTSTVEALDISQSQDLPKKAFQSRAPLGQNIGSDSNDEREFENQLKLVAKEFNVEVDLVPVICGRRLPLFRLWQVVCSDDFGGYEEVEGRHLWSGVAKALNYNEFKHSTAPVELQKCYKEILVDFEEIQRGATPDLTQPDDQIQQTPTRNDDLNEEEEDKSDVFVTPMQSSSGKRRVDVESTPTGSTMNKRSRLDKGKETVFVSPTPERLTTNGGQRPRVDKGKSRALQSPSPEKVKEVPSTPDEIIHGTNYSNNYFNPSSPNAAPELSEAEADFEAFKDRWLALGYYEEHVQTALLATGCVEANFGEILESLLNGRGIPQNIKGVWTENDDEALEAGDDTIKFARVRRKHGVEGVEARRKFKEMIPDM